MHEYRHTCMARGSCKEITSRVKSAITFPLTIHISEIKRKKHKYLKPACKICVAHISVLFLDNLFRGKHETNLDFYTFMKHTNYLWKDIKKRMVIFNKIR